MQPNLIGFLCQSGAYTFYESGHPLLRSVAREFQAFPVVHVLQVQITDAMKAFRLGAAGVLLAGCETCWNNREAVTQQHTELLHKLAERGIVSERCRLEWCSAQEAEKFFAAVAALRACVRELPPLRLPITLDETIVHCG
ncbi:hydrogenase iron-sulfur subunit [candidate division KSB1 bacterium]|nr:hydrogenase iron-sulfur subunit [candidate division KSB1 bacterium]